MWLLIHAGISWQDVSQYPVSDLINQYGPEIKSYRDLLAELWRQVNCFTVLTCITWQLGFCCVVARCGLLKQSSNLKMIPGPLNLFSAAYMIFFFTSNSFVRGTNKYREALSDGKMAWPWRSGRLDAWASRVKCPARFVSHLHKICIYMSCL